MANKLDGQVALVTGASRGIGYATAKELAQEGAHVIAVARTVGGLEELDDQVQQAGGACTLVPLDLKDGAAIDRLGGAIYERWGKLDIFVGNAGILGNITPLGHLEPKLFEEVMAINVTANWRFIRSLDPLLRQSDAGRVLFLTSGAARNLRPYWGPYSASKAALEAMAVTYAKEMAHTKVKVVLVNPGPIRTQMRARAVPGENPETLTTPQELAPHLVDLAGPDLTQSGVLWDFAKKQYVSLL